MSEWEKIGTIGVDAGLCWVGDPCYVLGKDSSHGPKTWKEFCDKITAEDPNYLESAHQPLGEGIGFSVSTGWGDGEYPVYVKRLDGRIAAVKVVFLGEDDEADIEVK